MGLIENFGKQALESAAKLTAMGVAQKAVDELNTIIQNSSADDKTEYEKAEAAERAARREETFQKIKKTAGNAVRKVQDSIEKRQQEKKALFEAEIARLYETYPLHLDLHCVNDNLIDGAELFNEAGMLVLKITTKCPRGRRLASIVNAKGESVLHRRK